MSSEVPTPQPEYGPKTDFFGILSGGKVLDENSNGYCQEIRVRDIDRAISLVKRLNGLTWKAEAAKLPEGKVIIGVGPKPDQIPFILKELPKEDNPQDL